MSVRDLIDKTQKNFVNSTSAPTRAVVYTRNSDSLVIPLNAFVDEVEFNQDDKDSKRVNRISFRGLILTQEPTFLDTITYDGKIYKVRRWTKVGDIYSVEAENAKQNKMATRSFK